MEIFFHTNGGITTAGWSLTWIAVTPGLKDFIQTESFVHLNCHYKHFYAESMAIHFSSPFGYVDDDDDDKGTYDPSECFDIIIII